MIEAICFIAFVWLNAVLFSLVKSGARMSRANADMAEAERNIASATMLNRFA